MKKLITAAVLAFALALTGCASLSDNDVAPRAAVLLATGKFVRAADDQSSRADEVYEVASRLADAVADGSYTSLADLEDAARAEIPWQSLQPEEVVLVDGLLVVLRDEIEERLAEGVVSAETRLQVAAVLRWVAEGAGLYR